MSNDPEVARVGNVLGLALLLIIIALVSCVALVAVSVGMGG